MHLSDALLTPWVAAGFCAASGALLAWSTRELTLRADNRLAPTMGMLGACVFAFQLLNFAIPGTGSSGHLAGGMLVAALLGPAPAFVVMTSVLLVQCLVLGDGGLLALGANLWNLGFYPCFVGLPLARMLARRSPSRRRRALALGVAAFVSVELGALSVVLVVLAAHTTPLAFGSFSALMTGIHVPIALAEGFVTAVAAAFLWRLRPELERADERLREDARARTSRRLLGALGLVAMLVTGVLTRFSSALPDGLEWSLAQAARERSATTQPTGEPGPHVSLTARPEQNGASLAGAAMVLAASLALGAGAVAWRRRRDAAARTAS